MHNYLTKIMILLAAIVVVCANAGVSPNIMHAATVSSSGYMSAMPVNAAVAFMENALERNISLPGEFLVQTQNSPAIVLSPTQPLGSLVAITWNNLDIPEEQPDFSQFLILPTAEAPMVIDSKADNYSSPFDINLVAAVFHYKLFGGTTVSCTDCHGSLKIGELTAITHINDRFIDQEGDPASFVECQACHMRNSQQSLWHIRGVE